jgi:thiosulfate/3-mercaptopyruvate sulfurtransferase
MFIKRLVAAFLLHPMASSSWPLCPPVSPLVSTSWVNSHLNDVNLVVIDLRSAAEYTAGHIPGSISLPFEPVSA